MLKNALRNLKKNLQNYKGERVVNEIRILSLDLRNFKGINSFVLSPEGKNVNIYGENATGKTTIMDAFIWLLFDKDSQNSSNFNIKTLDFAGDVIHGLEHEVIAVLEIDKKSIELQKTYKEKWTKKRGEAERVLTGHTTDYFINGVPKKKSEYENYLANIIDEETFKILTNPLYFNTMLHWKDRRNLALNICGEIEDSEIFKKDEQLNELESLLEEKTVDDLRAEMASRRRKLNEKLKSIPYRIDELTREDTEIDVESLTEEKNSLEGKLIDIKNSGEMDYDSRLRTIDRNIDLLELETKELEQEAVRDLREQLSQINEDILNINTSYYESKSKLGKLIADEKKHESDIERMTQEIEKLRKGFMEVSTREFDQGSTICPTCNQILPQGDIEKLIKDFDFQKNGTLASINVAGKELRRSLDSTSEDLKKVQEELAETKEQVSMVDEILKEKSKEYEKIEEQIKNVNITELKAYKEIQEKLSKLYAEKDEVKILAEDQDNSEIISGIESKITEINKELARVDLAKESKKRIEDLKDRERELAQMVAETEKIEFLCEQYIITKAELLEDKLNSKFKTVKFKLFDIQVNGGISETFVTTVDGVPFEDLNSAMRINAGLDIINTLTDYYNFRAPIFIDNRESINEITDTESQVINLIVSKHKTLRVGVYE